MTMPTCSCATSDWSWASRWWIDVDEFEAAAALAERSGRPDHAQAAIAAYGGRAVAG